MTLEKLQVIIEAQTKAYYEELKKVQAQTKAATSAVEKQTDKIKSAFGKIGKVIGLALSVTAIINFGRSCIELGSDLAEVQNVVDVTFGAMSDTINQWARNALDQFGLSETSAKKYTSTIGAMLKSMGFATDQAAEMSMEMAGLAADMASFYNLSNDEAFAKIRAGISGETEPLKQLGVNLSVANLQEYALSQGITKSYNAMTQQEQAMLRYNYLLHVTSDAQGDFARTSDGWANQVRILTERFNALKAAIGQGLIAVLTPVIRVLNQLLAKILTVTDAFSNLVSKLTGKNQKTQTTVGSIGDSAETATGSVDGLTDSTNKAGSAAKKTAKEFEGLGSFDEVHTLNKDDGSDSGGSGGGGGGAAGSGISENIVDAAEAADDELNPVLQKLIDRLKELQQLFKDGFKAGLGDVNLDGIKEALAGIKRNLKEIFTDPAVVQAANECANKIAYALGQVTGAITSIGITIGTNLLGGINKYLEQNKDRVKGFLVDMFNIEGDMAEIYGNFAQAAANIFSVFGGENGQQATANLIGIFADAFMGIQTLSAKFSRDVLNIITKPFIDNQGKIKEALNGTLGVVSGVLGNIKSVIDNTMDKANEVYDAHLKPMFDAIATGLSKVAGTWLDAYQQHILPAIEGLQKKIQPLIDNHLQPAINKGLQLIGKIADAVKDIWNKTLVPFMQWYIKNVAPIIGKYLTIVGTYLMGLLATVGDVVGYIFDALGGLIDFIAGVFTGDWKRAWEGIKTFFTNIWNAIVALVKGVWNTIKTTISTALSAVGINISSVLNSIKTFFSTIWNSIKTTVQTVWNAIKSHISSTINAISTTISTVLNTIKTTFSTIFESVKTTVTTIFNAIKSTISTVISAISTTISTVLGTIKTTWETIWGSIKTTLETIWNGIKSAVSTAISAVSTNISTVLGTIKTAWETAWNSVKTTVTTIWNGIKSTISTTISTIQTNISTTIGNIKTNWETVWGSIKTTVVNVFSGMWTSIKGSINSILGGVESMANGVIKGFNKMIKALNNLSFDVPDWVPEIGGKKFGFNLSTLSEISIPKLALGGVVDSATLAMIGENGQEAVVPLENNTGWMDKIASRIAEVISVNISALIADMDQGGDSTITTIVKLDSKTLVEQTDKYRRRKGYQMAEA